MARSEREEQAIIAARQKVAKQKARQGLLVPKMEQIGKKTKKNQVLRNVSEGEERFSQIFESENPLKFIEENASAIKEFLSEAPSQRSQASINRRKVINVDNKSKFLNDLIREVELDEEKLTEILRLDLGFDDNDKKLLSQSLKEANKALCSDQDLTTLEKVSLVQVLEYKRGESNNLDQRNTALNNLMSDPSFGYDELQKVLNIDLGLDAEEKKLLEFSLHPEKKQVCCDKDLTNKEKLDLISIVEFKLNGGELEAGQEPPLKKFIRDNQITADLAEKINSMEVLKLTEQEKSLIKTFSNPDNRELCSDKDLTNKQKLDLISIVEFKLNGEERGAGQEHPLNKFIRDNQITADLAEKINSMEVLQLTEQEKCIIKASSNPDNRELCSDKDLTNKQKLAFLAIESYRKGELEEANEIKALGGAPITKSNIENGILNTDLDKLAIKFAGKKINFIKLIEDSSPQVGDKILQLSEKVAKVEKSPTMYWKKLVVNLNEFCSKVKVTQIDLNQDYITKDKNVAKKAEKMQASLMAKRNNMNVPVNSLASMKGKSSQQSFSR